MASPTDDGSSWHKPGQPNSHTRQHPSSAHSSRTHVVLAAELEVHSALSRQPLNLDGQYSNHCIHHTYCSSARAVQHAVQALGTATLLVQAPCGLLCYGALHIACMRHETEMRKGTDSSCTWEVPLAASTYTSNKLESNADHCTMHLTQFDNRAAYAMRTKTEEISRAFRACIMLNSTPLGITCMAHIAGQ